MCAQEINILHSIQKAAYIIQNAQNGVVLTGAGISTPSGIPDFRSSSGLWKKYNPFEVASLSTFRYKPENFFHWFSEIASNIQEAKPNPAHIAITALEEYGHISTIITQNIDNLHQLAGSKRVLEIHGSLQTATCIQCFKKFSTEGYISEFIRTAKIPYCPECGGVLKPNVILLEEQLPHNTWVSSQEACKRSDLMIIIGSSLEVMPVAGLPMVAIERGAPLIIVNKSDTYLDVRAEVVIQADAADVLPQIAKYVAEIDAKNINSV